MGRETDHKYLAKGERGFFINNVSIDCVSVKEKNKTKSLGRKKIRKSKPKLHDVPTPAHV